MIMSQDKGRILMRSKNTLLIFLGGFITAGVLLLCLCKKIMDCCSGCCSGEKEE